MSLQIIAPILLAAITQIPLDHPVFPPQASRRDAPALLKLTAFVRSLEDDALVKMVPEQSGLCFVGCPNCNRGLKENQLIWSPEHPNEVHCRYCEHRYPSAKYPMNKVLTVRNPRGEVQRYPYWENAQGYRYYFQARRDDLVREYLAERARDLALLYEATGARVHAWRAALLLDRFAQVFPGWCYHYDYPSRQKQVFDGVVAPAKFLESYRTGRWTWWAYMDVPAPLVEAYDWLRGSDVLAELSRREGTDVAARIERDLIRSTIEQVLANKEEYSNMAPKTWQSIVTAARVINEPRYVHEVVRRMRHLLNLRFLYDGSWHEGAPTYAAQVSDDLGRLEEVLRGYSDPPKYKDKDGTRFDHLNLKDEIPEFRHARTALEKLRLPDGYFVPVHDTWRTGGPRALLAAPTTTKPFLLPALGHACLGGGAGDDQTQFHLTWSGGYGHEHADHLSLLLFASGRQMLSDLGYCHTRYRGWSVATASHNTVVIDGQSQALGNIVSQTDGTLRVFDVGDKRVQVVSADGVRGYPDLARQYRRTLIVVEANAKRYAVDVFEVSGGGVHDYFLHGNADVPTVVTTKLSLRPLATLLPPGFDWKLDKNEDDAFLPHEQSYPYGFLRNLRIANAPRGTAVPVTFRSTSGTGPALQVTLFPEPGSHLIVGENPALNPTVVDEAQSEKFMRPFMMLRHKANNGRSVFATVLEPRSDSPLIDSIERVPTPNATLALRLRIGDRTDLVVCGAEKPARVAFGKGPGTFRGIVGVLSLRGEEVEHAFALGEGGWRSPGFSLHAFGPQRLPMRAVEGDAFVLDGSSDRLPMAGDVVRVLTADGWVYPYTVVAADRKGNSVRLRVAEGPGFEFDASAQKLSLTAFPQREHIGAVHVDWITHAVK